MFNLVLHKNKYINEKESLYHYSKSFLQFVIVFFGLGDYENIPWKIKDFSKKNDKGLMRLQLKGNHKNDSYNLNLSGR